MIIVKFLFPGFFVLTCHSNRRNLDEVSLQAPALEELSRLNEGLDDETQSRIQNDELLGEVLNDHELLFPCCLSMSSK